jgi:cell division protein FtsZ
MHVEAEMGSLTFPERSIEEIAKEAIPHISVVGIGGGGSNIISWMKKGSINAKTIALNSDAQHLSITKADERILLGYKTSGGLGCGGFPEQGIKVAEESTVEIERALRDSELIFVTTTLGGGTGTGASPVVAKIAKEVGGLTLGVVTIPFQVEGMRLEKAREGLKKLVEVCDSVIVIDNNRLRKLAGNLPLRDAFGLANEQIADFIRNLSEALSYPGHVNMDFADVKAIMKNGGICAVGFGEGSGDQKVEEAVEKATNTQLLDIGDMKKAEGALVCLEGGEDMTLEDVNRAAELVMEKISPTAKVSWGARINSELEDTMKAIVVLAGVDSPFLASESKPTAKKEAAHKIAKKVPAKKEAKKSYKLTRTRASDGDL